MLSVRRRIASNVALSVTVLCVVGGMILSFRTAKDAATAAASAAEIEGAVVRYPEPWHPTEKSYKPGSQIYFDVVRYSKRMQGEPMPLLIVSSVQNVENGMTYRAELHAHIIDVDATVNFRTVRTLPEGMLSGRYKLVGWAKTQSDKRPAFATFESEPFEVIGTPP